MIHITDSESTERKTKLLNDGFDVMNGRNMSESITESNWKPHFGKDGKQKPGKKAIIQKMLSEIELTESFANDPLNRPQLPTFASQTTLEGWRLTILSTIGLTEELLYPIDPTEKYDFVLTARWNQDPLEVNNFKWI